MARTHFYYVVTRRNPSTSQVELLEDVLAEAFLVNEVGVEDSTPATIFVSRTSGVSASGLSNADGVVSFWLDPGDYNIHFSDTAGAPRISDFVVGSSSVNGAPNGVQIGQLPAAVATVIYVGTQITGVNTNLAATNSNLVSLGLTVSDLITTVSDLSSLVESPPRVKLTKSGFGQTVTNNTFTDVTWEVEDLDPNGFHSGSAAEVTVPTGADGFYLVTTGLVWVANATGERITWIELNTNKIAGLTSKGTSQPTYQSMSAPVALVAGDALKVRTIQDSGSSLGIGSSDLSFFSLIRLCA